MDYYKPSQLHELLKNELLAPNKVLSQNFLIDQNIIDKIIDLAELSESDLVIEIGPGPGALTEKMLQRGCQVIAIEKDDRFASHLTKLQKIGPKLDIICSDVLDIDFNDLLSKYHHLAKQIKIVSNLPYHLTTKILELILPLSKWIKSVTIMVQKEAALRMLATNEDKNYGYGAILTEFYSKRVFGFLVKRSSFYPRPNVDSAVIQFILKSTSHDFDKAHFFRFIKSIYSKKNKTLRTQFKDKNKSLSVEQIFEKLQLDSNCRPLELDLQKLVLLFKEIEAHFSF